MKCGGLGMRDCAGKSHDATAVDSLERAYDTTHLLEATCLPTCPTTCQRTPKSICARQHKVANQAPFRHIALVHGRFSSNLAPAPQQILREEHCVSLHIVDVCVRVPACVCEWITAATSNWSSSA
eukprot:2468558-Pleurochrysis_carterae.AAC.1